MKNEMNHIQDLLCKAEPPDGWKTLSVEGSSHSETTINSRLEDVSVKTSDYLPNSSFTATRELEHLVNTKQLAQTYHSPSTDVNVKLELEENLNENLSHHNSQLVDVNIKLEDNVKNKISSTKLCLVSGSLADGYDQSKNFIHDTSRSQVTPAPDMYKQGYCVSDGFGTNFKGSIGDFNVKNVINEIPFMDSRQLPSAFKEDKGSCDTVSNTHSIIESALGNSSESDKRLDSCDTVSNTHSIIESALGNSSDSDKRLGMDTLKTLLISKTGLHNESKQTGVSETEYQRDSLSVADANSLLISKGSEDHHSRSPTGKKLYECVICGKNVKDKHQLILHIRTHTGEKPFKCMACGKTCSEKGNLKQHILRVHCKEGKSLESDRYRKHLISIASLDGHIGYTVVPETKYQHDIVANESRNTGVSGTEFVRRIELINHVVNHNETFDPGEKTNGGEERLVCGVCGELCFSKSSLIQHHKTHSQYHCKTCGKLFSWKTDLDSHARIHHGIRDNNHKCDTCGKVFVKKNALECHRRIHTGQKPFQCAVCGRTFNAKNTLNCHARLHTGEKPFQCVTCDKWFTTRTALTRHTKIHAQTVKLPFECITCGKSFYKECSLTRHMETHSREKWYECLTCGKTYYYKSTLKYHCRTTKHWYQYPIKK